VFYILNVWDFAGWLVAEEKIDGVLAGDVGRTDPCGQPNRFTRFNGRAITERQRKDVTAV